MRENLSKASIFVLGGLFVAAVFELSHQLLGVSGTFRVRDALNIAFIYAVMVGTGALAGFSLSRGKQASRLQAAVLGAMFCAMFLLASRHSPGPGFGFGAMGGFIVLIGGPAFVSWLGSSALGRVAHG